jgi:hypothetical protein
MKGVVELGEAFSARSSKHWTERMLRCFKLRVTGNAVAMGEAACATAALSDKLDADEDGFVSEAELTALWKRRGDVEGRFPAGRKCGRFRRRREYEGECRPNPNPRQLLLLSVRGISCAC